MDSRQTPFGQDTSKCNLAHGLTDIEDCCPSPSPHCREAVQFIAANILRLAAAGTDIAALDSALVTKIAKVRQCCC